MVREMFTASLRLHVGNKLGAGRPGGEAVAVVQWEVVGGGRAQAGAVEDRKWQVLGPL